jgi:DNA invertase Pin-like site-specific DNA recombinase
VVSKLDRLSRSMLDFTGVMATAQKQNWALAALDCAVDTTTPAGEAMAHVLATFAQFERRLIGQRTRDALAAKKAQAYGWAARADFLRRSSHASWRSERRDAPSRRSPMH